MLNSWLDVCLKLASEPADFYTGCRKILRGRSFIIEMAENFPENNMTIADAGFTNMKLTLLRKLYLHEESIAAAQIQWQRTLDRGKYSSASFHCFNHYTKQPDPNKRSKRASVMGPCIQAVSLTYDRGTTHVDAFYRTTELFKKFPADLVFIRDTLLPRFQIDRLGTVRFHMANITCHPMYFVTLLPNLSDWRARLDHMKEVDRRFFDWTIKWTARYVCEEFHRGIAKFAQALRVKKDATERMSAKRLAAVQEYCRTNHPGYRNDYQEDQEDDDE